MRSLLSLALFAGLALHGCKTPDSQSGVKAAAEGEPMQSSGFDLASLNDSFWKAEFEAQFAVVVTLKVEQDGSGVVSVAADGETQTLEFAHVRFATPDELDQTRNSIGRTFLDSRGVEITYTEAVVIADEQDSLKNVFPVLSADELMMNPVGPLIRQADSPEADKVACGGMAGLKCPTGFVCKGALLDKKGVCVQGGPAHIPAGAQGMPAPKPSTSQQKCGGFAGFQCPPALICKVMPPHPDGMGVCVEPANKKPETQKEDEDDTVAPPKKCGTIAGLKCGKGQVCQYPKSAPPDAAGVCVDKKK